MSNVTKAATLTRLQKTIAGIAKYFPNAQTLTLKGKATPTLQVNQQLQAYAAAIQASENAQSAAHDAVVAEQTLAEQVGPMLLEIKGLVIQQLGEAAAVLSDFDITVATPKKPSVAAKAEAVAKRATTRKQRGTKGKKQRLEVTVPATEATAAPPATKA